MLRPFAAVRDYDPQKPALRQARAVECDRPDLFSCIIQVCQKALRVRVRPAEDVPTQNCRLFRSDHDEFGSHMAVVDRHKQLTIKKQADLFLHARPGYPEFACELGCGLRWFMGRQKYVLPNHPLRK